MFPNENAPAWFEKARWPSGLSAPSVARLAKRSTCLGQVLAPQDVQSAVQRHRRYADAPPPPSADADMGTGDLPDRVAAQGFLGREAE